MKKILVPFDFDNTSRNAVRYAIQIAKKSGASIVLYHGFIPVYAPELPYINDYISEFQSLYTGRLNSYVRRLSRHFPGINIQGRVQSAYILQGISGFIGREKPDLVVIGLNKKSFLEEALIGSTSLQIVLKTETPVIAVPLKAREFKADKVLIATDFHTFGKNDLNPLVKLLHFFDAEITVMGILKRDHFSESEIEGGKVLLGRLFRKIPHRILLKEGNDIPRIIRGVLKEEKSNILVMMPGNKSFLEILMGKSSTRDILRAIDLPVLLLGEKSESDLTESAEALILSNQ
jgi:nucleotide-binding universal stress UspA family protein